MLAKAIRAALFTGLVLALWTFARPARADVLAPFCDDRGATALAPPPALEPTDQALLRASAPPSDDGGPSFGASLVPARHVFRAKASEAAVRVPMPAIVSPSPISALVVFEREALPQAGVRFRIERPPRG